MPSAHANRNPFILVTKPAGSWGRGTLVSVQFCLGLASHLAPGTDKMYPNVRFAGLIPSILRNRRFERRSILLFRISSAPNRNPFELIRLGSADWPVLFFQRQHPIYRNGQGGCVWTFRTTYSKGCRSLHFFQEYVKPVSSNDLYEISLFHDLPLRRLTGCRQEKCTAVACWFIT